MLMSLFCCLPDQHAAHRNFLTSHIDRTLWDALCIAWDMPCAMPVTGAWPTWRSAHDESPDVRELLWHHAERVLTKCHNKFGSMSSEFGRVGLVFFSGKWRCARVKKRKLFFE